MRFEFKSRSSPELKHTKYIWLKNEVNLKAEQKETLLRLKDSNLQTGRAYRLKLSFQDFWSTPHILADVYLREWIGWANRSQLNRLETLLQNLVQRSSVFLEGCTKF
ncbi:transposase [Paenibacillus profundus]|uniref:transposase n=1 Tax=Paenibacillus profundus TaxID=1173085 RepID=UPI003898FF71